MGNQFHKENFGEGTDGKPKEKEDDSLAPKTLPKLITISNIRNSHEPLHNIKAAQIVRISNCQDSRIVIVQNKKLKKLVIEDCQSCVIQVLDSCVVGTRVCDVVNTKNTVILFEDVDIRHLHLFDSSDNTIQFADSPTLIDAASILCIGDSNRNKAQRIVIDPTKREVVAGVVVKMIEEFPIVHPNSRSIFKDGTTLQTEPLQSTEIEQKQQQRAVSTSELQVAMTERIPADDSNEFREYHDSEQETAEKIRAAASYIRRASHVVCYTGAGISTSAKIPDYRGPQGVWTLRDKGQLAAKADLEQALPTYAHYAICELARRDRCHFVVSTNLDGLHRRAGLRADQIAELHGNCYREVCAKCQKEYLRPFDTCKTVRNHMTHITGRKCDDCGGDLKDTIIHFSENMPEKEMAAAVAHAKRAQVALVLGTSMNVQPAASLPDKCLRNPDSALIIVNLQRTPYDDVATLKIHMRTDDFMRALMCELGFTDFDVSYDALAEHRQGSEPTQSL